RSSRYRLHHANGMMQDIDAPEDTPPIGREHRRHAMRTRGVAILAASTIALATAGCGGGSGGSDGGQLEGVSWALASYRGTSGTTQDVPAGADVTARFDAGTVAGN